MNPVPYDPASPCYLITDAHSKALAIEALRRHQPSATRPLMVTIDPVDDTKTSPQRRLYWWLVHAAAAASGATPFEIHYELICLYLPERAHLLLVPGADITKDLSKRAYSRLIDQTQAHLSSRGLKAA